MPRWRASRPEAKLAALVPGRCKLSIFGLDGIRLLCATIDFREEQEVSDGGRLRAKWKSDRNTLVMTSIDSVYSMVYLMAVAKGCLGKNIERPDGNTWLWELARQ